MFERYTEKARRTIFFARYEASEYGTKAIETEHLLLGILREDKELAPMIDIEVVRGQLKSRPAPKESRTPTNVDLPLSEDSKRALHFAAKEAKELKHSVIDTRHLMLGLMRLEGSVAADLIRQSKIDPGELRRMPVRHRMPTTQPSSTPPPIEPLPGLAPVETGPLGTIVLRFHKLAEGPTPGLRGFGEPDGMEKLSRCGITRKEALGHLIDLTIAHHHWIVRALNEPELSRLVPPNIEEVARQNYKSLPWEELVETWEALSFLLAHVLACIPEARLEMPCRIGVSEPISLMSLIERYVERAESLLGEILTKG